MIDSKTLNGLLRYSFQFHNNINYMVIYIYQVQGFNLTVNKYYCSVKNCWSVLFFIVNILVDENDIGGCGSWLREK